MLFISHIAQWEQQKCQSSQNRKVWGTWLLLWDVFTGQCRLLGLTRFILAQESFKLHWCFSVWNEPNVAFYSFHESFYHFGAVPQISSFSIKLNKIHMLMKPLSGVPLLNLISLAPPEVCVARSLLTPVFTFLSDDRPHSGISRGSY